MASSRAVPVLPIDGVMPTSPSLSAKESAVYWAAHSGKGLQNSWKRKRSRFIAGVSFGAARPLL